ncbi:MAG: succinate dehydrogenase [Candidatus Neomarinimicrobiota bacterium]|nr:MAG: succinate dehydrogenase [Candidatus Neomarinimicrobiota bacterium]
MNWFFQFMNSSVGKKITMATTGLLLCLYLVIHLFGNLFLYAGPEAFNLYVERLSSLKPLVRVIEVILTLIFVFHIWNALRLTLANRRSSGEISYTEYQAHEVSALSSRFMGVTGSILFIFLVVHLQTIWYTFQTHHQEGQFYAVVTGNQVGFGNPVYAVFYLIAMFLLGFHLKHGFQSAFQTFGIRYNKYGKLIEAIAVIFWLIIPATFATIPIYFGFLKGGF